QMSDSTDGLARPLAHPEDPAAGVALQQQGVCERFLKWKSGLGTLIQTGSLLIFADLSFAE
ncbi:MAG: hypothetical protein KGN36_14180, partial [Acidobacteriota bacterium]|nr:hypothetical protein [Acidobacteriota bacterium]